MRGKGLQNRSFLDLDFHKKMIQQMIQKERALTGHDPHPKPFGELIAEVIAVLCQQVVGAAEHMGR